VWLVPDLAGSYEQQPPNLLEELRRDRRWCQGNLRNARLIAEPGLHPVHRAMLATGVMAYLSAPLWLAFVLLGAFRWWHGASAGADHAFPMELVGLWACTLAMLALPRVLGVLAIVLRHELPQYGGASALVRGALLEGLLSVLQAPVRMIAHSLFVGAAFTGLRLEWKSPPREATAVTWAHAVRRFAPLGAGAAALLAALLGSGLPTMAWWFLPVALPLLLATPLAVLTSRAALGERARAHGLLLTPEELGVPTVLRRASVHMRQAMPTPDWRDVLTDPWLFKVVCLAMGPRDTTGGTRGRNRSRLIQRAAGLGVDDISAIERMRLMSEPQSIAHLRARLVGG
jgi:membrane glycosyltransferase